MIEQSQRTATKSELFDKLLKSLFIAVFFSAFVFPRTIYGCSVMHSNAPKNEFDHLSKKKILVWVCENLNKNYIFVEVAREIENYVRKQFTAGKYRQANNTHQFAEILTKDLQAVSKDEHIKVLINSSPPPYDSYSEGEKEKVLSKMIESDRRENFHFKRIEHLSGNVGYLRFDRFDDADYAGPTDCDTLKSYAGMYGPIRITYDDDGLFILESGEKNLKKLYPLSETLFVIEGNEKIRGQFERDGKGEVVAVIGIIAEGSKQRIPKTREKMEKPERTADETLRDDDSRTSPGGVNDKIFDELDIEFAYVEGGSFQMGDTFGEGRRSEIPVHNVILDGFYLSTTEVTFAQYDRFCEDTGREKPDDKGYGRGNLPVINVNWNDAVAFCLWLSEKSGRPVRLPTEAEWEYAARERGEKVRFGNGQDIADPSEINFDGREKHKEPYSRLGADAQKILPVASSPCNSLGLYDMSGNVWEWVADWFDENYYRNSPVENPTGPSIGTYRVLRGGAWRFGPRSARCANRGSYIPGEGNSEIGFRLAITK